MSGEIIEGLERKILELEIVACEAKGIESLLIEWAKQIEENGQAHLHIEERMLIAARAIEERRGLIECGK